MATGWGKGSTRQWRRIRAAVLARDRNLCQVGLPGCTITATCVHHTVGRAVSGDDPRYLVAACQSCNLRIGEPGRRRKKAVPVPRRAPQQLTLYDRW
jgi:5-methylcytosine-specific restriction endonuclease McrA